MLSKDNADFATRISGQPLGDILSRRIADRKSGAKRGLTLATGGEVKAGKAKSSKIYAAGEQVPLIVPTPQGKIPSSARLDASTKGIGADKTRNQSQIEALQKKEYLKTYIKDKGIGTTSKPDTVKKASYKVATERKEPAIDRPIINGNGTVSPRGSAAGKKKQEKQLTQEEKEEKARLAGIIGGTKRASSQETYEESYPKRTIDDVISDNIRKKVETKQGVADAEKQNLSDKYGGQQTGQGFEIPYITPAFRAVGNTIRDKVVNPVAQSLIGRDMDAGEVRGTLAALTLAPVAAGTLLYQNHKTKEAEKEKQAQAQSHRDKVQEIIAKRNLLLEHRQSQPQQSQARVPYNFFSAAPLSATANFEIGFRNPFFIKKEKALPLAAVAGGLIGTYGLLSKLNKQRALDAYKVNGLKDKNAQDFAANYFDSPQYHADNLIREAASMTGNPLLQGITDNPLDRLTPTQKAEVQKRKGSMARYSRGREKVANFFDPFITPAMAIGSTAYGIYNKKKASDEQSEVFEAQKLAALSSIKDRSLRQQLLAKAQGRVIDDDSKNRMIDSALNGDVKSVFRTGLKKVNWDAL